MLSLAKTHLPTPKRHIFLNFYLTQCFSRAANSKWIYSSRHEQKAHRNPGQISIFNHVSTDTHNASLRLVQKMNESHIILTNNPQKIKHYMEAIKTMRRFANIIVEDTQTEMQAQYLNINESQQSSKSLRQQSKSALQATTKNKKQADQHGMLLKFDEDLDRKKQIEQYKQIISSANIQEIRDKVKNSTTSLGFDSDIEVSKMIQMQNQLSKQKGEANDGDYLAKQASEIKKFMEVKRLEEKLKEIRDYQGYSAVFSFKTSQEELEGFSESQILKMQEDGLNILFLFSQDDQQAISSCGQIVNMLENSEISYQILPSSDGLLQAIVCSGLPADRFSIQYYPQLQSTKGQQQSFQSLLQRRKSMKITTCIAVHLNDAFSTVQKIKKTYGKHQIIYIQGPNKTYFRDQVLKAEQDYFNKNNNQFSHIETTATVFIIVAPFISSFNQQLQKQLNIKSHIMGEIMSPKINPVEMKILINKLEKMNKKEEIFQINTHLMVAEMLVRIKDEQSVRRSLKRLFPRKKDMELELMIEEGRKHVVVDHLWGEGQQSD